MNSPRTVAVLGASQKPDRYSNRAVRMLLDRDFRVIPVHPKLDEIEKIPTVHNLDEIDVPVDTLTLYVGPARLERMLESIVTLKPGRVIFNPGTESELLQKRLAEAGIPYLEACTLVMLQTGQF